MVHPLTVELKHQLAIQMLMYIFVGKKASKLKVQMLLGMLWYAKIDYDGTEITFKEAVVQSV